MQIVQFNMWSFLVAAMLVVTSLQFTLATEAVTHHRSRRQTSFSCESTETLVRPPLEYEDNVQCKDIIGRPINRYKMAHRKTCQRWLGLPTLPESVASSYVDECYQYSNGTARYKSRACCFGATTAQRCFTCDNKTNGYECKYKGQVTTCPAGQVCMTQNKNYKRNGWSYGYMFAQCADTDQCQALSRNNSKTCQYYIPTPSCTNCCSGPFCNYGMSRRYFGAFDDACGRRPCSNGGTCVLQGNSTTLFNCICRTGYSGTTCSTGPPSIVCLNGGYRTGSGSTQSCYCPITKTGLRCELNTTVCDGSGDYQCLHGGTCYNHTASGSGLRCLCKDGWIGANCEQENKLKCTAPNGFYKLPSVYNSGSSYYNSINCTQRKAYVESGYIRSYTGYCPSHMRRPGVEYFRENVHGSVGRLESISLSHCSIGDGLLRYQFQMCCPSCYSNPCENGGWCQQNTDWDYVCQCRFGYEGRNCSNKANLCVVSGDPHYTTVDGKIIHFQGPCKYNLVSRSDANNGLPDFSIMGRNEKRPGNQDVTYLSYLEVNYAGHVIKLKRDGVVTVDDVVVYPDHSFPPHFQITKNGRFTRFETTTGLIVEFDGYWIGLIKLPDSYANKVDGLCGNFDGDADNDMRTSTKVLSTNYAEIGNSWQVADSADPACSGPAADNPPTCSAQMEQTVKTNNYCGLLADKTGIFGDCLSAAGSLGAGFYTNCEFDVCSNQGNLAAAKVAACGSLESFVELCKSLKYSVLWRTAANCPAKCSSGMVFKEKTSACHATCETPDGPEKCRYPDTENCVCPDDNVLINGTCQKPEMCKCPGGRAIGSTWLSEDCGKQYKCEACKACTKRKVARVYEYENTCSSSQVCQKVNGIGMCQSCSADGNWSPWSVWGDCSRTSRRQTRSRTCNNPPPACGGRACTGDAEDSRSCIIGSSGPTEPPKPLCAPLFDFQAACAEFDRVADSRRYMNPCSTCDIYYQCSEKDPLFGYYNVYERNCSPCTCWSQAKLTCDHDPLKKNPNNALCKTNAPYTGTINTNDINCSYGGRRLQAIPGDVTHYKDRDAGDINMPCSPGTQFSVTQCQCIHGTVHISDQKPIVCLDFNDIRSPFKNAQNTYVSWTNMATRTIFETGVEGTALRLSGGVGGRLEIPHFNNKEFDKITISFWYKRDTGRTGDMTLVSIDDCRAGQLPSVQIYSQPEAIGGGIRTNQNYLGTFANIPSASNRWHHVVMTYDSQTLTFYLDGNFSGSRSVLGFTPRVQCPMLIGSMYDGSYFYGLIDQVCLYDQSLSAATVRRMFAENKPGTG